MNKFIWNEKKKNRLPNYSFNHYFVYQFFNNFSALLLLEINFLDFFDKNDYFQTFVTSRNFLKQILIFQTFHLNFFNFSLRFGKFQKMNATYEFSMFLPRFQITQKFSGWLN